jgi:hypothetical protein
MLNSTAHGTVNMIFALPTNNPLVFLSSFIPFRNACYIACHYGPARSRSCCSWRCHRVCDWRKSIFRVSNRKQNFVREATWVCWNLLLTARLLNTDTKDSHQPNPDQQYNDNGAVTTLLPQSLTQKCVATAAFQQHSKLRSQPEVA